MFKSQTFN